MLTFCYMAFLGAGKGGPGGLLLKFVYLDFGCKKLYRDVAVCLVESGIFVMVKLQPERFHSSTVTGPKPGDKRASGPTGQGGKCS